MYTRAVCDGQKAEMAFYGTQQNCQVCVVRCRSKSCVTAVTTCGHGINVRGDLSSVHYVSKRYPQHANGHNRHELV
jgi:hypothetical protein